MTPSLFRAFSSPWKKGAYLIRKQQGTRIWYYGSATRQLIFFSSHDQGQHFFSTHPTSFSNFTLRLDTQTKRRKGRRCPPSQPLAEKKTKTDAIQEQRLPHNTLINPLKRGTPWAFFLFACSSWVMPWSAQHFVNKWFALDPQIWKPV